MSQPTREEFKQAVEYLLSLPLDYKFKKNLEYLMSLNITDKIPLVDEATLASRRTYGTPVLFEIPEKVREDFRNKFGNILLGWKDSSE